MSRKKLHPKSGKSAPAKKRGTKGPASRASVSPKSRARRSAVAGPAPLPSSKTSKQAKLTELLRRPEGATLDQMMAATGWQAHSVRGVISGVLKKRLGLAITSKKDDEGLRSYYLTAGASHG